MVYVFDLAKAITMTAFPEAGNAVQSERGNQRDGLWLARMNLATHYSRSNTVGF